jgi:O-antigen/teichoic acid export membrane protein
MSRHPAGAREQWRDLMVGSRAGVRDVLLMLLPQAVLVLAGFVTTVLAARGLGPAAFGHYGLVLSVTGLTAAFSDLGIGQTAIRYASRAAAEGRTGEQMAVLRWALRLRLAVVAGIALLIAALAPVVAGRLWHAPELALPIRIGLLAGVFTAVASVPSAYFQSTRRFGMNAAIQVGQAVLALAAVLVVAWLGLWTVEALVAAGAAAAGLGVVMFLFAVPRAALLTPRGESAHAPAPAHDADGGPAGFAKYNMISTIVVLVTLRLDVWLMGVFSTAPQIGHYTVASRFALPLGLLLAAVTGALWPRVASRTDPRDALFLLERTFQLSVPLGLLALTYGVVAPMLTPWMFGATYADSQVLAQVLCVRYALAILIVPIGVIGYSLGFVRVYWIVNLVQLAVVAAINVVLLPRIGPMASALALVANELVGLLVVGPLLLRRARQSARGVGGAPGDSTA